jgi:hypothetical protein
MGHIRVLKSGAKIDPLSNGRWRSKPALGEAALDQSVEHCIADRTPSLVGYGGRGAQRAGCVTIYRPLNPRSSRLDAQGTDAVHRDLHAVDVGRD